MRSCRPGSDVNDPSPIQRNRSYLDIAGRLQERLGLAMLHTVTWILKTFSCQRNGFRSFHLVHSRANCEIDEKSRRSAYLALPAADIAAAARPLFGFSEV